uniref:Uncharacterized protein n=1 Tax=Alexandrium monilatum TaxID=311494 RepID=A0A7S4SFP8_9DINO
MNARDIDAKDPGVTLDLLKTWASEALARQPDQARQLHGWEALVSGLCHAACQRARDSQFVAELGLGSDGGAGQAGDVLQDANLTESDLRRRLVFLYSRQAKETVRSIVQAKLNDELSFFHSWVVNRSCEKGGVELALSKWDWYLYCLTFETGDFLTDIRTSEPMLVQMPLDTVDLRVVAQLFNVQITVTRMFEEAMRFRPHGTAGPVGCCHLLLHKGLWTALLDVRMPEQEPQPLLDAVVEVEELPLELQGVSTDRTVLIRSYDEDRGSYMACCGQSQVCFPVERSSIKRIIFTRWDMGRAEKQAQKDREEQAARAAAASTGDPAWAAEEGARPSGSLKPLEGIPEGSLEFQVLQELVRRTATQRLSQTMGELAGRNPASVTPAAAGSASSRAGGTSTAATRNQLPTPARNETEMLPQQQQAQPEAQQQQQQQQPQLLQFQPQPRQPSHAAPQAAAQPQAPLQPQQQARPVRQHQQQEPRFIDYEEVRRLLESGSVVTALCLSEFAPDSRDERYLVVRANQWVRLNGKLDTMVHATSVQDGRKGWCSAASLIAWVAESAFEPDPSWPDSERYMGLRKGEAVLLEKIYDGQWADWGFCRNLRSRDLTGLVPLSRTRRHFYCA